MVSSASPESRIVGDVVVLLGVERRVEQQPAHADHRVHRRADLVAHRGEERALRLVGGFGRARAPPAPPGTAARSAARRRRWRQSCCSRRSSSASYAFSIRVLWTLSTPRLVSATRIGTPRYERARLPTNWAPTSSLSRSASPLMISALPDVMIRLVEPYAQRARSELIAILVREVDPVGARLEQRHVGDVGRRTGGGPARRRTRAGRRRRACRRAAAKPC